MKKVANTHLIADVSDFHLLAVHSTAPAYHLAWCINDAFSFELSLSPKPFELYFSEDANASLHRMYCCEPDPGVNTLYMIENTGSSALLAPGKPPADHFLAIRGEIDPSTIKLLESRLKQMKHVNFAYSVPDKLTQKQLWLLGLEECSSHENEA